MHVLEATSAILTHIEGETGISYLMIDTQGVMTVEPDQFDMRIDSQWIDMQDQYHFARLIMDRVGLTISFKSKKIDRPILSQSRISKLLRPVEHTLMEYQLVHENDALSYVNVSWRGELNGQECGVRGSRCYIFKNDYVWRII